MFALADCNNFYVSCERVFDPGLAGKAVIVLSNNDGCAVSRSEEAKAAGIEMGAAPHLIKDIIRKNDVRMFSSNYTLYGDMSDRVMRTFAGFVPSMEVYSIDEAFLDMSALPYTDLRRLGMQIRQTVLKDTGIPVSIGIAATKALAKMANRYAKKHCRATGVHWAADNVLTEDMLAATSIGDVWGIGKQYTQMLKQHHINTALDFTRTPEDFVRAKMSVTGLRLQAELKGINCIAGTPEGVLKKAICSSRSFGELTSDKGLIKEALSNFAANCALKLRVQKSLARELKVYVNTNPHRLQDRQYYRSIVIKMDSPTNETPAMIKYAVKGLEIIFREGLNYKKCGVEALDFVPEGQAQGSLFADAGTGKSGAAINALDKLNKALGKDLVRFGTQGFERRYKARAAHLSPRYTTRLEDIIRIKD